MDDLSKAKELLEISEQTGKKVFIGQSSRFFEPAKRQRADFESGEIEYFLSWRVFHRAHSNLKHKRELIS
jgi:predicted dehydrogenase